MPLGFRGSGVVWTALGCIELHCAALGRIGLRGFALSCTGQYWAALGSIGLHWAAWGGTGPHWAAGTFPISFMIESPALSFLSWGTERP